jgi:hypothetical protein
VFKDGNEVKALDSTIGRHLSTRQQLFYATLRTAERLSRPRGYQSKDGDCDLPKRRLPSLSPDETRIAFKKMLSRNNWRLSVLDLKTLQETPLAETRIVDDQQNGWTLTRAVLFARVSAVDGRYGGVFDGSGEPKSLPRV